MERAPLWEEPLSTTQNTRRAEAYGWVVITWGDQVGEGLDPGRGRGGADHLGAVHVVGGEVGQGAATGVLELDPAGTPRSGWLSVVAPSQGLELGLLIGADHVLVLAERAALPLAGVQVQHSGGLDLELGVAGEDPGPVLPRLDRVGRQPPPYRAGRDRLGQATGNDLGSQFRARPPRERHPALTRQGARQRLDVGDLNRGEPPRTPAAGQVHQPGQASRGEPSSPLADRVEVNTHLGSDHLVIATRRRGQHDPGTDHVPVLAAPGSRPSSQHRVVDRAQDNHQRTRSCHEPLLPPTSAPSQADTPSLTDPATVFDRIRAVPKIPDSTKSSLHQRLSTRARQRWPALTDVAVRYRAGFAYIDGVLGDGEILPLCRLRYAGSAHTWGFAIYRASHDDYEDSFLPTGSMGGTAEDALDTACGLYLTDPTAWT